MIRIRHSAKPYEELDIEGSSEDFSELRLAILGFCDRLEGNIDLPAEAAMDSSPYQRALGQLRFCRTEDPILISVTGGTLFISGKPAFLRLLAENLPCDAAPVSQVPCHEHFDRVSHGEFVSEASLNLVLTLKT